MLVLPNELQTIGSHRRALAASRIPLPSAFDRRCALAWLVGAFCLLCFLEEFPGTSWADGTLTRGTTLARARVLPLPSAQRIEAVENNWQELTLSLREELLRGGITSRSVGSRLSEFVQGCNDERMRDGDYARFELVTPPGGKAPILQLEWTGN